MFGWSGMYRHLVSPSRFRDVGVHGTQWVHRNPVALVRPTEPNASVVEL